MKAKHLFLSLLFMALLVGTAHATDDIQKDRIEQAQKFSKTLFDDMSSFMGRTAGKITVWWVKLTS